MLSLEVDQRQARSLIFRTKVQRKRQIKGGHLGREESALGNQQETWPAGPGEGPGWWSRDRPRLIGKLGPFSTGLEENFKLLLKLTVKHVFLWPAVAIVKGMLWPGQ